MNHFYKTALVMTIFAGSLYAETPAPTKPTDLKTLRDKASYSMGLAIGQQFAATLIDPNLQTLLRGIQDGLAGKQDLTDEQIKAVREAYDKEIIARLTDRNVKQGTAFLAANRKKEGVKTVKSGLQYKVLKAGKGKDRPGPDDTVSIHYVGKLVSGEEFDNSYRRREPLVISMASLIPGWTEALQAMTVGSKWQLVVPPELASAENRFPPTVGPQATLIYELELLAIEQPESLPPATDPPAAKSARPPASENRSR